MPVLAAIAKKRISGLKHVTVHEGDSSSVLPDLVHSLRDTMLFWLDGHCSDGVTGQREAYCPIFAELRSIFLDRKDDCYLMIDDARFFNIPSSG